MTKYFRNAFATGGDRDPVPDLAVGTLVNYEKGYTPEYELDPDVDPAGNYVGRRRMNQLFNDITGNLKFWQENGVPKIVANAGTGSPLSYKKGFVGSYLGVTYRALIDDTATLPPSAEWVIYDLQAVSENLSVLASPLSKSNCFSVAFYMDGAVLKTTQKIVSAVGSKVVSYDAGITVSLPELVSGKDYKIYALETGTLQALEWDSAAPSSSTWIGGFLTSYSNGTIVERSLWDMNWRPSCSPRGMALSIDGQVWVDVWLIDVDYGINGYSRPDVTIADGASLPKIPAIYGGNGSATYPTMSWYNAIDLAAAAGKRLPTYTEFTAFAYGVVEQQSVGTDPITTKHQAGHRSASGIEQVTGVMWQWGADIQGSGSGWQDITGGRGSVNATEIRAVLLGSYWDDGAYSGSRASNWDDSPSYSSYGVGARAVCDHQIH